jgi:indolepyruvate ferredoxin oxidoreductase
MQHQEVNLIDKYDLNQTKVFISGVQALVRLPLEQAQRDKILSINSAGFISGYRGSPLGGYDMQLNSAKKLLDANNIHFWPGLNEDLGATAVWGSQALGLFNGAKFDGVFGIWYGKAPGVDRSGDVFKHANFAGTSKFGGALAIAGDDPNCKSSTLPSQSEFAFIDAEMPFFAPSSVQEVLDFGLYGIALSRYCGAWVGLIALADAMDSNAIIDVRQDRLIIKTPDAKLDNLSIRRNDEPMAKELRLRKYKLPAAQDFVFENGLNKITINAPKRKYGIIASGQAYNDVLEAIDYMGLSSDEIADLGVSLLKIAMPWPLEPRSITEFAKGHQKLLIVEHKRPLIENQIKEILYDSNEGARPQIIGKANAINSDGFSNVSTIAVHEIGQAIMTLLVENANNFPKAQSLLLRAKNSLDNAHDLVGDSKRNPHFCSGCPHNTSTIVPEGSRALAGIGCHYMANFMPNRNTDMTSHMGGEGVTWIGQAPFTDEEHIFANLGDGTYSHSGSLAIRAAVTAGVNITYKLLYNDAVAMTGGQKTESGQSVPQIAKQLLGEGVAKVVIVSDDTKKYDFVRLEPSVEIIHRDRIIEVQENLRKLKGVTILIYEQICATEKRRRIKRGLMAGSNTRIFINEKVCEGCGDCSIKSNCLSIYPVETEFGTKREIDQSSCNQDMRCIDGFCPSFVSVEGAINAKRSRQRPEFDATLLPLPQMPLIDTPYSIIFGGVGGTGVTTISAILGMAAHIDGKNATTLDMTGLAQKGGQVLSHIRIAKSNVPIHSGRVPIASANAAIIGDLIVATNLDALQLVSKDISIAVANSDISPTSEFIFDRNRKYQNTPKIDLYAKAVKSMSAINAEAIANEYLYDAMFSNMVLMGYAWQRGLIPVSLRGIYRAIKLNGSAVNDNMLAFDLGRIAAHDPDRLNALVPPRKVPEARDFDDLVASRSLLLEKYQNKKLGNKYSAIIENAAQIEKSKLGKTELSYIFAQNLYKLMAYKDEYEVARLYCEDEYWQNFRATLGKSKKLSIWLAPPFFAKKDKNGQMQKKKFGPWIFGFFKVLKTFKFLRGSIIDPFAYIEERKQERKLIKQYIDDIGNMIEKLDGKNIAIMKEIANLPQEIRGYGHVKEKAMHKAQKTRQELFSKI